MQGGGHVGEKECSGKRVLAGEGWCLLVSIMESGVSLTPSWPLSILGLTAKDGGSFAQILDISEALEAGGANVSGSPRVCDGLGSTIPPSAPSSVPWQPWCSLRTDKS